MQIQEVHIENMKGTSTRQALSGKDIFIGPNGVGKSTRLQALGTALLGYVPGAGKSPNETFKTSSNQESMMVGLSTDSFSFQRQFHRKERAKRSTGHTEISFSEQVSISPSKGEKTNTEKKARIEQEVGSFPVMVDFNEFLNLTDNKRRDFMYDLSESVNTWDKDRLIEHLQSALIDVEMEVNNPDFYQTLKEAIDQAMNQFPSMFSFTDGLNAVMDWVNEELKFWRKKKKDSEGAVRSFADMKNRMNETDRHMKQNKEDVVQLRERLTEIKEQLARDTEKKKAYDQRIKDKAVLQEELQTLLDEELTDSPPYKIQMNELASQKQSLPESKAEEYQEHIHQIKQKVIDKQQSLSQVREQMSELKAKKGAVESTVQTINDNQGVCVIHKQIACNKDFSAYLTHADQTIKEFEEAIGHLMESAQRDESDIHQLNEEQRLWERRTNEDNNHFRSAVNHNQHIDGQIREIENKILEMTSQREAHTQRIESIKKQIEALDHQKVEAMAPLDILEQQRDSISQQIKDLESKVEQQQEVKNQMMTLKSSMLENKKADLSEEAYKALQKELGPQGVQGLIVQEQLEPIKRDIESNLKIMGIDHEVFFQTKSETGQDIFQFGWVVEGTNRNFDALSTGQQLMYLIAFMVTILDRANPPLKVLALDNIENLDRNNFKNVLEGLNNISDKLHNIVLAGVMDKDKLEDIEGWAITDLSISGEDDSDVA